MNAHFPPIPGTVSHIGLKVVATPRTGLTADDLIERLEDADQHIEDIRPEGVVLADVVYENGVYLDHSEASQGEFVWGCEHCGMYSRTKAVTEAHEHICPENPENAATACPCAPSPCCALPRWTDHPKTCSCEGNESACEWQWMKQCLNCRSVCKCDV